MVKRGLVSEDETLSSQWDHTKNAALGFFPDQLTQGSGIKVWWLCPNKSTPECDNECVHSWPAIIASRASKTDPNGCPFCSDGAKRSCRHNCLATTHPHLVTQWVSVVGDDIDQFGEKITPFNVKAGSNVKVLWKCPVKSTPECDEECIHLWPAKILSRSRLINPSGCPFCSDCGGAKRCCRHTCVAATHPDLVEECMSILDDTNQLGEKITLFNVSAGSNVKVLWKCLNPNLTEDCDHEGCQHSWEATIRSRAKNKSGCCWAGCCPSPSKFCIHYSLACKRPDIASQWHPTLNQNSAEPTPDKVLPNSAKEKYWICLNDQSHYWIAAVYSRVSNNTGCPHCKHKTEAKLEAYLLSSFPDLLTQIKIMVDDSNLFYDFFIPSLRVYIELDGAQHYRQVSNWAPPEETRIRDVIKMNCAWSQGCSMIRISQIDVFGDQFNWQEKLAYWLEYFKSNTTLDIVFITSHFDSYELHIQDLAKSVGDTFMIIRRDNVVSVIPKIHISKLLSINN